MKIAVIILIVATTLFIVRSIYKKDVAEKEVLEEMVMPGLVSDYHAKYENDCSACHSPFSKESQDDKCISCHKEVGKDLIQKSGYHGRFEHVSAMKCKSCHTEHNGRNAVIVLFDRETFDHKFTDYILVGAHTGISVGCEDCHKVGEKYRVARVVCFNCHEKDDIHKGRLGQECKDCHKETSFKNASFDHSETGFALEGKHKEVVCSLCHPDESYKNIPEACIACHLINDIHDSKPDEECGRCHNSIYSWSKYDFDHSKETKFDLKDRHATLKCDSCHPQTIFKERPGLECFDCHEDDDIHKRRTGSECEKCHDSISWKQIKFDHNKDTDFKLLGKHKDATCIACHKAGSRESVLDITCIGCHRPNDVHQGQLGAYCDICHNVNEWAEQIKFEHDLTQFPLIGQHAITPCGECHFSSSFKEGLAMNCFSCHRLDDGHELKLGTYCADCHNPNGWRLWEFDHNSQTEFTLKGPHSGLKCETCHREPMEKKVEISNTCYSCHQDMDVHLGRFGRYGERCDLCHHNVNEFKIVNNFHKTSWQGESALIEKDCYTCHEVDDIHYGGYGHLCDRCHIVESFIKLK
jgi:hypothetical protein